MSDASDVEKLIGDVLFSVFRSWPGRLTKNYHSNDPNGSFFMSGESDTSLVNRMATAVVTLLNGHPHDDHIIKISAGTFTIQHPLIERINSSLFDCTVHNEMVGYFNGGGAKPAAGEYRIAFNENGGWAFEAQPETGKGNT